MPSRKCPQAKFDLKAVIAFAAAKRDESCRVNRQLGRAQFAPLAEFVHARLQALREGRRIYLFGNGGSAADTQHIAAELLSRLRRHRAALPAVALTTNTSVLTAVSNNYGFTEVFVRQVEGLVRAGDVVVGITTSGRSVNVLRVSPAIAVWANQGKLLKETGIIP